MIDIALLVVIIRLDRIIQCISQKLSILDCPIKSGNDRNKTYDF